MKVVRAQKKAFRRARSSALFPPTGPDYGTGFAREDYVQFSGVVWCGAGPVLRCNMFGPAVGV